MRNCVKNRERNGKNKPFGRPPSISSAQKRQLMRSAADNFKSNQELKAEHDLSIGVRRFRQILKGSKHLVYTKMKRKPYLSSANIEGRLKSFFQCVNCANNRQNHLGRPN